MEKNTKITLLLVIVALVFVLRMPFFSVPPERDEGVYATAAEIILDGGAPYKDAVIFRAPGIFYTYALLLTIFGHTVEALRIGSTLFTILTLLVVFKLAKRLYGDAIGVLSAILYGLFSSGPLVQGSLANTEIFMMLPAVAATYIFYNAYKEDRKLYFFAAGILSGIACLFKEAALPNFLLFLIFVTFVSGSLLSMDGAKKLLRRYLVLISGFIVPISMMLLFLYINGAFYDYIIGTYNWNRSYGSHGFDLFVRRLIDRGVYNLGREYSLLWFSAIIFIFWTVLKERTIQNIYVILWILLSFVGVCLGSMFFPHYFIQMIPSLSIAGAFGILELYKGFRSQVVVIKTVSCLYALLLIFFFGYAVKTDYKFYLVFNPDEISKEIYGGEMFVTSRKIAQYVKERTQPSDYIYQNRWDAEVYFLAQRRTPTKYIEHHAINATLNVTKSMGELRDDILYKEPKYIIWFQPRPEEIPEFIVGPIIKFKYELETEIGGVKIFRLKTWKG